MKLSDYMTLKELSERHCINYHTLRRRAMARGVLVKRVGVVYMIPKKQVAKLVRGK